MADIFMQVVIDVIDSPATATDAVYVITVECVDATNDSPVNGVALSARVG